MNRRKINGLRSWQLIALLVLSCRVVGPTLQSQLQAPASAAAEPAIAQEVAQSDAEATTFDYAAALESLQTALMFQGEPVNPRAVAALIPWLSDTLPGPIAVDIEGTTADTNQFNAVVARDNEGRVFAEWTDWGESQWVGYQSLGRLENGTHVLRVWVNTGGSEFFPFLLLVHFDLDTEITQGVTRQRLSMMRRGEFILGSEYDGEITISGNMLTLSPAPDGGAVLTVEVE